MTTPVAATALHQRQQAAAVAATAPGSLQGMRWTEAVAYQACLRPAYQDRRLPRPLEPLQQLLLPRLLLWPQPISVQTRLMEHAQPSHHY